MAHNKTGTHMHADAVIIGGGLAGLSAAALMAAHDIDVVVIDHADPRAQMAAGHDIRTTAISLASKRILDAAGVWQTLVKAGASPIREIRVADMDSAHHLHFDSADIGDEPFGWIVDNGDLRRALAASARHPRITHLAPAAVADLTCAAHGVAITLADGRTVTAALLVGADGRASAVRAHHGIDIVSSDYHQSAVVFCMGHTRDHEGIALEHFMPEGPFAVLPMVDARDGTHRSSVVWTVSHEDAATLRALDEATFNARLQDMCGDTLGDVHVIGMRAAYPLMLQHAKTYTAPRTVLIAEAAHVIHPIAGQGLNVSLRDAAHLVEGMADALAAGGDVGSRAVLDAYSRARVFDVHAMGFMTDSLNRLFSTEDAVVAAVRQQGLSWVGQIAPLKRFFAYEAMGLGGVMPNIVRKKR